MLKTMQIIKHSILIFGLVKVLISDKKNNTVSMQDRLAFKAHLR